MPKPTNLADWGATAAIVEPSAGVKSAGWLVNQRLPPQWLNWWMRAVALWMVWLDAFESTTHNWLAGQNFNRGVVIQGNAAFGGGLGASIMGATSKVGVMGGASAIGIPWAIINTGGVAGTSAVDLVIPIGGDVTGIPLRVYREITTGGSVNGPGGIDPAHVGLLARVWGLFEATRITITDLLTGVDATFSGSLNVDVDLTIGGVSNFNNTANFNGGVIFGTAAQFAIATDFDAEIEVDNSHATIPTIKATQAGAGPAVSATSAGGTLATVKAANSGGGPAIEAGAGHYKLTGTHPASDVAFTNQLTPGNIIKAEVSLSFQNGVDPTIANGGIHHGFNIDSVTVAAGGDIKVFFKTPFVSSTKYSVYCQIWGGSVANPLYFMRTCDVGPVVGAGMDAAWCILRVWARPVADAQVDRAGLWNGGDNCRLNIQFLGEQ